MVLFSIKLKFKRLGFISIIRFDKETSQWKERGLGEMTILWNKRSGKGRVLMRREQILKLCCNHLITEDMELKCHQGKWETSLLPQIQ